MLGFQGFEQVRNPAIPVKPNFSERFQNTNSPKQHSNPRLDARGDSTTMPWSLAEDLGLTSWSSKSKGSGGRSSPQCLTWFNRDLCHSGARGSTGDTGSSDMVGTLHVGVVGLVT